MTALTVAVTGATGFVGRHVVAALLERGHTVRALVRDRAKAIQVLPKNDRLQVVLGDVLDGHAPADLIRKSVSGNGTGVVDAVVHLVGIIREGRGGVTFQRMHVGATRAMVQAAVEAGVPRYLQMSALGVSDHGSCAYQTTKWEAEQIVIRSGLRWTIFRPGMIHGPGSSFLEMAKGWVSGQAAPWIFLPYFTRGVEDNSVPLGPVVQVDPAIAPVHVDDVAAAFAAALDTENAIGEIYNLAGPERFSWPAFLNELRDGMHGNPLLKPWGIPSEIAGVGALAASSIGLGALLPFDHGMAVMGGQDSVAETSKVREHLGLRTRPFKASFAQYAGSL